jgi:hypothetical protein
MGDGTSLNKEDVMQYADQKIHTDKIIALVEAHFPQYAGKLVQSGSAITHIDNNDNKTIFLASICFRNEQSHISTGSKPSGRTRITVFDPTASRNGKDKSFVSRMPSRHVDMFDYRAIADCMINQHAKRLALRQLRTFVENMMNEGVVKRDTIVL